MPDVTEIMMRSDRAKQSGGWVPRNRGGLPDVTIARKWTPTSVGSGADPDPLAPHAQQIAPPEGWIAPQYRGSSSTPPGALPQAPAAPPAGSPGVPPRQDLVSQSSTYSPFQYGSGNVNPPSAPGAGSPRPPSPAPAAPSRPPSGPQDPGGIPPYGPQGYRPAMQINGQSPFPGGWGPGGPPTGGNATPSTGPSGGGGQGGGGWDPSAGSAPPVDDQTALTLAARWYALQFPELGLKDDQSAIQAFLGDTDPNAPAYRQNAMAMAQSGQLSWLQPGQSAPWLTPEQQQSAGPTLPWFPENQQPGFQAPMGRVGTPVPAAQQTPSGGVPPAQAQAQPKLTTWDQLRAQTPPPPGMSSGTPPQPAPAGSPWDVGQPTPGRMPGT